ncbi:PLP-dependent cysteine synthase family protein [Alkalicoccobacillus porphyridii]|uniref:cysteine synthase n=1 Tax=Alkalicoccobacillus porphyridii TaxID=2597270 RepID=A0A554A389_9BACI|nr:cysteine synthase family protein [Alkalicoccobacillus porphyridii]TSB48161.1 cysteine synthase family protein [Alkalicoccobacillus porphyridii]
MRKQSVHTLIGNTPLIEVRYLPLPEGVRIFAKLEYLNPGGSIKDRLGINLIHHALQEKHITANGTIIEPTAGNTGIGLALAAVGTSISICCIIPEGFSQEKVQLIRALGAKVIRTPKEQGIKGAIEYARALSKTISDSYCPMQFENPVNPKTYYETLAPEIWSQLDGKVDIFVAGAGSGGTFTGMARYLKERNESIRTVIVEPEGSILNGGEAGAHQTEGIGMEKIPAFLDLSDIDHIYTVSDKDAFRAVEQLARNEGLLVGSSSGAAFHAAFLEAKSATKGTNIVTIFPDSSDRYLSKGIYKEEEV